MTPLPFMGGSEPTARKAGTLSLPRRSIINFIGLPKTAWQKDLGLLNWASV
jgi:hypothetical protein